MSDLAMDATWNERAFDESQARRTPFPWTDEQIETLKLWRSKGFSFGLIAKELGCSRHAAIGKANRLGLCEPRINTPKKPVHRMSRVSNPLGNKKLSRIRKPPTDYQPQTTDVVPLKIPFMELVDGQCRYVIGEADGSNTLYCGHPVIGETSYCRGHFIACHELPWKVREQMKEVA